MALRVSQPRFEARKQKHGDGWYVLATWPTGSTAEVKGFASEPEAQEWIENKSVAWLKARQTGSHD